MTTTVFRDELKRRSDGLYAIKLSDEILDYPIDWGPWLAKQGLGDTILSSAWDVPGGLTLVEQDFTTSIAVAWISGGTPGQRYLIVNHITTAGGGGQSRHVDQPFWLEISE